VVAGLVAGNLKGEKVAMTDLEKLTRDIVPVEQVWRQKAAERQDRLTKPPGSLGKLEEIACRMAAIQGTLSPSVDHKRVVVFAGDHGVTEEGVSSYPSEVTAQMVANFLRGGAAINSIARSVGAELVIVDAGVASAIPAIEGGQPGVEFVNKPVRPGTRNFTQEPALTVEETLSAISLGFERATDAKRAGVNLIGMGEMGIGNTTSAAAVTSALTGFPAEAVTGRGTGAGDEVMARKKKAVEQGVRMHAPTPQAALHILRCLGGLEMAALTGLCLGAASHRIAAICDGFIASASAAVAVRLCPAVGDYLFAGHLSTEPGHAIVLGLLEKKPLLHLEMRLGEGSGAALAMAVVDAAVRTFTGMATFASAGVSNKQELAQEAGR
jgi:nicotinate-nucleotide--dimethylbenzimidazole phosphoribosyltransferase